LEEVTPPKKSICTSRSFGKKVNSFNEMHLATATYAAKCALKLRQQKSCASLVTVFVTTNRFSENDRQYANSKTICLPNATSSYIKLIHYANISLKAIYR
jgi:DNA polymerase V